MSATLVSVDLVEEIAGPGVAKSIRAQLTGQGDACPKCGRALLSRRQLAARVILYANYINCGVDTPSEALESYENGLCDLARRALCICEESEALNEAKP